MLVNFIKIGANVFRHFRYFPFQLAEVAIDKGFAGILLRNKRLWQYSVQYSRPLYKSMENSLSLLIFRVIFSTTLHDSIVNGKIHFNKQFVNIIFSNKQIFTFYGTL